MLLFLLFLSCYSQIFGAVDDTACESTTCYQNVNTSHINLLHLIDRLNSTTSSAKVPKIYDTKNLKRDLSQLKKIDNETRKVKTELANLKKVLTETEQRVLNDQNTADLMKEKLDNLTQYSASVNTILKTAHRHQESLENLYKLAENASKTCQQGPKLAEFEKVLDDVMKKYEDTKTRTGMIKTDLEKTLNETLKVKKTFDELKLPSNLIGNYLNEIDLEVNGTMHQLKENMDLLKKLLEKSFEDWNDQIIRKVAEIMKNIAQIRKDISEMDQDLLKYEKSFPNIDYKSTIDDESIRRLEELKKLIKLLEDELNGEEISEIKKRVQQFFEMVKDTRLILKELNLWLDVLPTREDLKHIELEINLLRTTISLVEDLDDLRREVELLRQERDDILKINCTFYAQVDLS